MFSQVVALFNVKSSFEEQYGALHLNKTLYYSNMSGEGQDKSFSFRVAHDIHVTDQRCTSGMYFTLFVKWCWAS